MRRHVFALLLALLGASTPAPAAEVRVLSAGAIEPGLREAVAVFERDTGDRVQLQFATAPAIRARLTAADATEGIAAFEIVIAPPAVLDAMPREPGDAAACDARIPIGRVGLGVAVGPGVRWPDITSAATFRQALLDADSLVYNRASTGLYLEGLLKRIGIDAQTAAKTTRYADGAAVMKHVLAGREHEIGLGAITEILLAKHDGVQFVGPLPAALQNLTDYAATSTCHSASAGSRAAGAALLRHLASPSAQTLFRGAGIDASP